MNMEELFDIICQHFITKRGYFEIFGHQEHLSSMEGWVRGEIVWLMHQSPLKEYDIFMATGKGKEPGLKGRRPDLKLRLTDDVNYVYVYVELKTITIAHNVWDYVLVRQLASEFKSLLSNESDWFISVTYSLKELSRWDDIVKKATDSIVHRNTYYVRNIKNVAFDIGDNQKCLISLFGRGQKETPDAT